MVEILLLRFDAPMVSFGTTIVDNFGFVQTFPALSMLTGLLANALGYEHHEYERLESLQSRLHYAVRCDRPGEPLEDYQTVDLGQDFMISEYVAWTTRGAIEERKGGNSHATHIRYRHYRADSLYTLAITLEPPHEPPRLVDLEKVLDEPSRPLFIGRKTCLPAAPLLMGRTEAPTLLDALASLPRVGAARTSLRAEEGMSVWWPDGVPLAGSIEPSRVIPVTESRDWANQIHCGRRLWRHGLIIPPENHNDDNKHKAE